MIVCAKNDYFLYARFRVLNRKNSNFFITVEYRNTNCLNQNTIFLEKDRFGNWNFMKRSTSCDFFQILTNGVSAYNNSNLKLFQWII